MLGTDFRLLSHTQNPQTPFPGSFLFCGGGGARYDRPSYGPLVRKIPTDPHDAPKALRDPEDLLCGGDGRAPGGHVRAVA